MIFVYRLVEYVTSFIECILLIGVYSKFFSARFSAKLQILLNIISSAVVMALTIWMNSQKLFSVYTIYVWITITALLGIALFRANAIKTFCISILYMLSICAFDLFCLAVVELLLGANGITLTVISEVGTIRTIYILSVKFVLIVFYSVLMKKRVKYEFRATTGVILSAYGIVFFSGLQSMLNSIVTNSVSDMRRSVLFSLVFVMLFMVSILVILRISVRLKNEQMENRIVTAQIKALENDNKQISNAYKEISKMSHDYANQMGMLTVLARNKKYEELTTCLDEIGADVKRIKIRSYTAIDSIDAAINSKVLQAEDEKILIDIAVACLNDIKIRQMDLCAIIVNLMDNAIEACKRIDIISSRYIRLSISQVGDMLMVKVENSYNPLFRVIGENGEFKTTKSEEGIHGYGIKIVKSIVERYSGTLEMAYTNDTFKAIAMLSVYN